MLFVEQWAAVSVIETIDFIASQNIVYVSPISIAPTNFAAQITFYRRLFFSIMCLILVLLDVPLDV